MENLLWTEGGTDLTLSNDISVQKAVCYLNNYKNILEMVLEMITWNEPPGKKIKGAGGGGEESEKELYGRMGNDSKMTPKPPSAMFGKPGRSA